MHESLALGAIQVPTVDAHVCVHPLGSVAEVGFQHRGDASSNIALCGSASTDAPAAVTHGLVLGVYPYSSHSVSPGNKYR